MPILANVGVPMIFVQWPLMVCALAPVVVLDRRVYRLLEERDEELAQAFDDFRRSTAIMRLTIPRRMGLLGDEELNAFSQQTRQWVRGIDSLRNGERNPPSRSNSAPPTGESGVADGSSSAS